MFRKFLIYLKQINTEEDYEKYDLFVGMDSANIRNMNLLFKSDPENKIKKLNEFIQSDDDISDPWYTGDFKRAYDDIYKASVGLIEFYTRYLFL